MNETEKKLLDDWRLRIRIAQTAHFKYAGTLKKRHLLFGLPAVILSTIVGTSVLGSLALSPDFVIKLTIGITSLLAAMFSSLQTFLNFSNLSEKHRMAANRFSALKKSIELEISLGSREGEELKEFMRHIFDVWNSINTDYPLTPEKVYKQVFNELNGSSCFVETNNSD